MCGSLAFCVAPDDIQHERFTYFLTMYVFPNTMNIKHVPSRAVVSQAATQSVLCHVHFKRGHFTEVHVKFYEAATAENCAEGDAELCHFTVLLPRVHENDEGLWS